MIEAIGFTTRDRPANLARCIRSFIAHCRAFGRRPRLIVLDDAAPGVHASALPATREIALEHPDFDLRYAGWAEKRDFADRLAARGLDPGVLEFALLDPEGGGYTLGANRNALMLETAGEQVLYVDDDALAETARPPEWSGELAVAGTGSTQRYWFYPDHPAACAAARFGPVDLLAAHEAYLGRPCPQIVAAHAGGATVWPTPWARRLAEHGVVKVTQNGVVGDSCMFSSLGHLLHGGSEGNRRLHDDPATLELALSSREIIRSAASPTLRSGGLLIGPDWGCDHSEPLVPFFPLFRSSDTSFSLLLSLTDPSWAFADVPWLVRHLPEPGRRYSQRGVAAPWRCSVGELIRSLLQTRSGGAFRAFRDPLRSVGERLTAQAAEPPAEFAALVRSLVDEVIGLKIARLTSRLDQADPPRPHHEAVLRRSIGLLRQSLDDPICASPLELAQGRTPDEALGRLQRLVGRFGDLLQTWREIDAFARAGARLAIEPSRALGAGTG